MRPLPTLLTTLLLATASQAASTTSQPHDVATQRPNVSTTGPATNKAASAPLFTLPPGQDALTLPLYRGGNNCYFVKLIINRQPAGYFLLDTGAHTMLDTDLAEKLQLPILGQSTMQTLGGLTRVTFRRATVAAGGLTATDLPVATTDMQPINRYVGAHLSGTLGIELFLEYTVTLDTQALTLTVHAPAKFTPPAHVPPIPLRLVDDGLTVQATLDHQLTGTFLLDTGAVDHKLYPAATKLWPDLPRLPHHSFSSAMTAGGSTLDLILPGRTLTLAGRDFPNLSFNRLLLGRAYNAPLIGHLGAPLIAQSRTTIDLPGQRLFIEPLPPLSLKAWLDQYPDQRARDVLGFTPLHHAAWDGRLDAAEALLASGAEVNAASPIGVTALFLAADRGHVDMVKLLLGKGASPNVPRSPQSPDFGLSPLLAAARSDHADIALLLLKARANPNLMAENGETALLHAATAGNTKLVEALLDAGADLNVKLPSIGADALHMAARSNRPQVAALLIKRGLPVDAAAGAGWRPIHIAASNGNLETLKVLLENKADIEGAIPADGATPLMLAASENRLETVRFLLAHGANPAAKDRQGRTVLEHALAHGANDPRILKALAP